MPEIFVTPAQLAAEIKPLKTQLDALANVTPVTSWANVQKAVRSGIATKIFSIGDQLICQRNNVDLVWDVIGIDHDTPADPQFTHSMTLQLHECFPTAMQFDAPEALYYCETALEAGTYHFTVSGTDYQFETASEIAAGSQLMLGFANSIPAEITVSATKGGTVSEGSITVTAGSGGEPLDTNYINDINRVNKGSNNYNESAVRQWMNSNAAAGSVWTPKNNFDRPPEWHTGNNAIAGFMNGMDADFLAVLGNVTKVTARNFVTDGGGSDTTTEKFFLPSRSEVYSGVEVGGVNEGSPYPYYADYSDLSAAGTGNDSNRIKYRNGTTQWWWERTPDSGSGRSVRNVGTTGDAGTRSANTSGGVAPVCNVI